MRPGWWRGTHRDYAVRCWSKNRRQIDTLRHTGHRSIADNAQGDLFIADRDGGLQRLSADGTVIASTNLCDVSFCNLVDIDL